MERSQKFWGFRIYKPEADFFKDELLNNNILRQGWGYKEEHDLRNFTSTDKDAARNRKMFNDVKCGDLLFVSHLFEKNIVTISKALTDWNVGYSFSISNVYGEADCPDFGHKFPAKYICNFNINDVSDYFKNRINVPLRFWEIHNCKQEIKSLLLRYGTNI